MASAGQHWMVLKLGPQGAPGGRQEEGSRLRFLKGAGGRPVSCFLSFRLPAHQGENSDLARAAVARPKGKVRARD